MLDEEQDEQNALTRPAKGHRLSIADGFDRPEDAKLDRIGLGFRRMVWHRRTLRPHPEAMPAEEIWSGRMP